jgi:hypothetical protein
LTIIDIFRQVPTRAREGREMTRAPKALVPLTTDLPNVASGLGDLQLAPPPPPSRGVRAARLTTTHAYRGPRSIGLRPRFIPLQVVIAIYFLISFFVADRVPAYPELSSSNHMSYRRMPSPSDVCDCIIRHIRALTALNSDVGLH